LVVAYRDFGEHTGSVKSFWGTLCLLGGVLLGCGDDENQTSAVGAGGFAAGGSGGSSNGAGCSEPIPATACEQWLCVSGDYVCVDDLPPEEVPAGCVYQGFFHVVGATFDANDGCNTCECMATNDVACSEIACEAGVVTPVDGGDAAIGDAGDAGDAGDLDEGPRDAASDADHDL
jgi:hypothetical protein